jgi:hypothetical protein
MRVRLVLHYNGLSIGAVRDVFEKSLGLRLQKMNPNTDYHCLKTFGSYFNEDIPIPAVRLNTGFGYRMFITFRYK